VVLKWSGARPSESWALFPIAPLKYPWSGRRLLQSRLPLRARREQRKACARRPQWTPAALLIRAFPVFLPPGALRQRAGSCTCATNSNLPTSQYHTVQTSHDTTPSRPTSHIPHPTSSNPADLLSCTLSIDTNIFSNFAAHPALLSPSLAKPIAVPRWPPAPHITSLQIAVRRGAFAIPVVTQTSPSPHTTNLEQNNLHLPFPSAAASQILHL
jgi:hypothetical protein